MTSTRPDSADFCGSLFLETIFPFGPEPRPASRGALGAPRPPCLLRARAWAFSLFLLSRLHLLPFWVLSFVSSLACAVHPSLLLLPKRGWGRGPGRRLGAQGEGPDLGRAPFGVHPGGQSREGMYVCKGWVREGARVQVYDPGNSTRKEPRAGCCRAGCGGPRVGALRAAEASAGCASGRDAAPDVFRPFTCREGFASPSAGSQAVEGPRSHVGDEEP